MIDSDDIVYVSDIVAASNDNTPPMGCFHKYDLMGSSLGPVWTQDRPVSARMGADGSILMYDYPTFAERVDRHTGEITAYLDAIYYAIAPTDSGGAAMLAAGTVDHNDNTVLFSFGWWRDTTYAWHYSWHSIRIARPDGTLINNWDSSDLPLRAADLAVDASGCVYALLGNPGELRIYSPVHGLAATVALPGQSAYPYDVSGYRPIGAVALDDSCRVFVTLGDGRVARYRLDADGDGLCDSWEQDGLQVGYGVANYLPPQADPNHKNCYVEVDAMQGRAPSTSVLTRVAAAFAAIPSASMIPPNPDLAPGITLVDSLSDTGIQQATLDSLPWPQFDAIKATYFAKGAGPRLRAARSRVWRYCLFADAWAKGRTGTARFNGSPDFFTALGYTYKPHRLEVKRDDFFAGTFMHELGHSIGLRHGGADDIVNKPNYHSVMNYMWQAPKLLLKDYWRLAYSPTPFNTLIETNLSEPAGIGGTPGDSVIVGPRHYDKKCEDPRLGLLGLEIVPESGPVDWDCDGMILTAWVPRRLSEIDSVFTGWPTLISYADPPLINLTPQRTGRMEGASGMDELSELQTADMVAEFMDCNENGVADGEEIAANNGLDLDADGVLDTCEPARVGLAAPTGFLCPAGDADSVSIDVSTRGIGWLGDLAGSAMTCVVRDSAGSPAVRLWGKQGQDWQPRDTVWATGYDAASGVAHIRIARASGCGTLLLRVVVEGGQLGGNVQCQIRSADMDILANGGVDPYDSARIGAALGSTSSWCTDLNNSGTTDVQDAIALAAHAGHSIPRRLTYPNGGETFYVGATDTLRWRAGLGDSARASLFIIRTGNPNYIETLALNVPDNGKVPWTVNPSPGPHSDYKVIVRHQAGVWASNNAVGRDTSDATFTVSAGGGCPVVDVRQVDGWISENTILGRSLAGAALLDDYRIKAMPDLIDSTYQLRIREDEAEYSTLDEVRLVALDHDPGLESFALGDRLVLGHRIPAQTVVDNAGDNVSALTSGSGGYFVAEAGETLRVELGSQAGFRATRLQRAEEGNGFIIDDGGKGGGGSPQAAMQPTVRPANADEVVLTDTGVLIQTMDGEGAWTTVEHHYPRENFDAAAVDLGSALSVRLVFLDRHKVRFVGAIDVAADSVPSQKLALLAANHSRFGDVLAAVQSEGNVTTSLAPQDTLTLSFGASTVPDGQVRELFLLSRGMYTSNLPASQHPTTEDLPVRFALRQNWPNPFSHATTIGFDLPTASRVTLDIFDLQGRLVRRVVERSFTPGHWNVQWDRQDRGGRLVGPGVYLYRIQAERFRDQKKMVLLP
ncbi:MAG TPA: T9SS type A sorting domain-containing protein [Candidatus Saccharimonadaceae bacterium]|nr:T9SS type A sorting domain-containing protein [Candidatus Saccharimonadaceae bacterium]